MTMSDEAVRARLMSRLVQCVFCSGAQNNERVATSPRFLAVLDAYPVTPGHTLVLPRQHIESFFHLTPGEVMEAYELLATARTHLSISFRPAAFNVGVNDGRVAGRTVDHLHIHLIPRYVGDVRDPRGGVRNMLPGPRPDVWASG